MRGGTSRKSLRATIRSSCISRSVWINIFSLMPAQAAAIRRIARAGGEIPEDQNFPLAADHFERGFEPATVGLLFQVRLLVMVVLTRRYVLIPGIASQIPLDGEPPH